MSLRSTNTVKYSKSIVLFNGTYWWPQKVYVRAVARGKSTHVRKKREEKPKFQALWECKEYEHLVPFFVNNNRSQ